LPTNITLWRDWQWANTLAYYELITAVKKFYNRDPVIQTVHQKRLEFVLINELSLKRSRGQKHISQQLLDFEQILGTAFNYKNTLLL